MAAVALMLALLLAPAGPAAAKKPASSPAPTQTESTGTPAPATHTLTVRINGNGTTDPDAGQHNYPEGAVVGVVALPDDGWDFDAWQGDVADAGEANTTTVVDANKTITATFLEIEDVPALAMPVNGGDSDDRGAGTRGGPDGEVDEDGDEAGKGKWSDRRIEDEDDADEKDAGTAVEGGRDDTAGASEPEEARTLTIRVKGSGTTEPDLGKHDYAEGTEVPIAAVPDGGWQFDEWKGDVDDDTEARTTITLDEDETVTAKFSEAPTPTPVADSEPADPTPTPEPAPGPTVVPIDTPEPTAEPSVTPEPTPEPTAEPTITPEPTPEPTAEPTITPELTSEPTAAPTATPEPTTAPGPLPVPALYLSRDSGEPGCAATVQGTTFASQVHVEIRFAGVLVRTVPTDEGGRFSAELAIPSSAQTGRNAIEASDSRGNTATAFFEVSAPPSKPQPSMTPALPSEATPAPDSSSTLTNGDDSSPPSADVNPETECEIDLNGVIDDSGVLTDDIVLSLTGGQAEVYLARGTVALDVDGLPVEGFRLERVEDLAAPSPDCQIVGFGYFCGPDGATFDPPAAITISYDPELCPEGSSSGDLAIAYFDAEKWEWVDLESSADTTKHSIAGQASHFSVFAVIADGEEPVSWSLVVGIIAGAVVLGVVVAPYLVRWRRRRVP